jgi:hypothetical protein
MAAALTRRHFLGQTAATASLAFAASLPANEPKPTPNNRLNLVIIGVAGRGTPRSWRPTPRRKRTARSSGPTPRTGRPGTPWSACSAG